MVRGETISVDGFMCTCKVGTERTDVQEALFVYNISEEGACLKSDLVEFIENVRVIGDYSDNDSKDKDMNDIPFTYRDAESFYLQV